MRTACHFHPAPRAASAEGTGHRPPAAGHRALTLLEMMISMTLLAVIMVGLLAMFSHTQKALHIAATQTDVFENARGAIQLVSRDLSEMTAYGDLFGTSAVFTTASSPLPGGTLPLASTNLPVNFDEAVWLTGVNDQWQGIGYYVESGGLFGVGSLFRFFEATNHGMTPTLFNRFNDPNVVTHRVSDGIVHFQLTAIYPFTNSTRTNFESTGNYTFTNVLPAFVDIDLGVLEPGTLKQFEALTNNPQAAKRFLTNQVGKIHFFRERVPIRNFINPYRANEVP